jgi:hypothetical protein
MDILQKLLPTTIGISKVPSVATETVPDLVIDDGHGLSEVSIEEFPATESTTALLDCAKQSASAPDGVVPRPTGAPPAGCTVRTLQNGDRVMAAVTPIVYPGLYDYQVLVSHADGLAIEITVANGRWTDPVAVTRAAPPLSIAQWTTIALSPLWQMQVKSGSR